MIGIKTVTGDSYTTRHVELDDAHRAMQHGNSLAFVDTSGTRRVVAGDKIVGVWEVTEQQERRRPARDVILLILNQVRYGRGRTPTRMLIDTDPLWSASGWSGRPDPSTISSAVIELKAERLIGSKDGRYWLTESGIQLAERLRSA